MSDNHHPQCPARMQDGRHWTIYDSPRVYNSFPRMDADELRQAMQKTPFLFAPFYDMVAVNCCKARASTMAQVQSGQLPFKALVKTQGLSQSRPVSGPLQAHRMTTLDNTPLVRVGSR